MKEYIAVTACVYQGRYYEEGERLLVRGKAPVPEHFKFVKTIKDSGDEDTELTSEPESQE